MKILKERKYRFVFNNGYVHDFWFTKLGIEWRKGDLKITNVDWKFLTKKGNPSPFHFSPDDITAIIDMGKTRRRLVRG